MGRQNWIIGRVLAESPENQRAGQTASERHLRNVDAPHEENLKGTSVDLKISTFTAPIAIRPRTCQRNDAFACQKPTVYFQTRDAGAAHL